MLFVFRLVSVGGDGMFTEVLHGIMARTHRRQTGSDYPAVDAPLPKPDIKLGIIPAGNVFLLFYQVLHHDDTWQIR